MGLGRFVIIRTFGTSSIIFTIVPKKIGGFIRQSSKTMYDNMTNSPQTHTYAAQLATEQGFEIYSGPYRILYQPNEIYKPYKPQPKIATTAENLRKARLIVKLSGYEELKKMGLCIVVQHLKYYYFGKRLAYLYKIAETAKVNEEFGAMPPDHYIEHDLKNHLVRLIGTHASMTGTKGVSDWVVVKQRQKDDKPKDVAEEASRIRDSLIPESMKKEAQIDIIVKEIPIAYDPLTQDLYCIAEDVAEPCVAICGVRDRGKSWLTNTLTGRSFWQWGVNPIVMNDWQGECGTWCMPWGENNIFRKQIYECLYDDTAPLPAIYLHLEGRPPLQKIMHPDEAGFKISMAFKKLMLDYESILRLKADWKMDKIMPRFRNVIFNPDGSMKPEFFECQNLQQLENFIRQEFGKYATEIEVSKKSIGQMVEKVIAVIRDMYNQNFFDVANKIPAEWIVTKRGETKKLPPWMAAVYCGLVPIFETHYYHTKGYFPLVMKHIVESVFEYQQGKYDSYFQNNQTRIWFIIDELPTITRGQDVASRAFTQAISDIAAAGRMHRIGLVYTTQNYSLTPPRIRQNTNFLFAFNQVNDEEVKEIAKDYDLNKDWKDDLKTLQKFECIGLSTTRNFIVYDVFGFRREIQGPIRGMLFPPLNQHTPPRKMITEGMQNA